MIDITAIDWIKEALIDYNKCCKLAHELSAYFSYRRDSKVWTGDVSERLEYMIDLLKEKNESTN